MLGGTIRRLLSSWRTHTRALVLWKQSARRHVVRPTSDAFGTSHTGRLNVLETLETHCFDQTHLSNLPGDGLCYFSNAVHFQHLAVHQMRTELQR